MEALVGNAVDPLIRLCRAIGVQEPERDELVVAQVGMPECSDPLRATGRRASNPYPNSPALLPGGRGHPRPNLPNLATDSREPHLGSDLRAGSEMQHPLAQRRRALATAPAWPI